MSDFFPISGFELQNRQKVFLWMTIHKPMATNRHLLLCGDILTLICSSSCVEISSLSSAAPLVWRYPHSHLQLLLCGDILTLICSSSFVEISSLSSAAPLVWRYFHSHLQLLLCVVISSLSSATPLCGDILTLICNSSCGEISSLSSAAPLVWRYTLICSSSCMEISSLSSARTKKNGLDFEFLATFCQAEC